MAQQLPDGNIPFGWSGYQVATFVRSRHPDHRLWKFRQVPFNGIFQAKATFFIQGHQGNGGQQLRLWGIPEDGISPQLTLGFSVGQTESLEVRHFALVLDITHSRRDVFPLNSVFHIIGQALQAGIRKDGLGLHLGLRRNLDALDGLARQCHQQCRHNQ